MNNVLKEAKRLHDLGFAIHWLHSKSKRPIESGWTTGARKDWKYLKDNFRDGMNVGVRLGTPSKIGGNFLAVVDVDVKSKDKKHLKEVEEKLKQLKLKGYLPIVSSGRGNGSRHIYGLTARPVKPFKYASSTDVVKVPMPSAKPSKRELAALSEVEIAEGLRLRPAWEIGIMGDGQQVVLPPSIHPDSGKEYKWFQPTRDFENSALIELPSNIETTIEKVSVDNSVETVETDVACLKLSDRLEKFTPIVVDVEWLPIPEAVRKMILTGEGVEDRSATLLPVATSLMQHGLSKEEILSVLTDQNTYLGQCAFDHAGETKSRLRAAQWLWRFTVKKVFEEKSAEAMFMGEVQERALTHAELKEQQEFYEEHFAHWTELLDRTEKGYRKPTFKNAKLMLIHSFDEDEKIIGRNEFAAQDYWLMNTPWGAKKGEAVSDTSILHLKNWLVQEHKLEFNKNTLDEVMQHLADVNRWHPVRDYLHTLKWDGIPRIDTWLKKFAGAKAPEPYMSDVSRKILVAMVKRIMEPGCKFDHVLILEGLQGWGKSSLVRAIAGEWFSDVPLLIGDKDGVMAMQSKWVIELGELSTMSKIDIETLKAFVTQQTDRMRPPYGKRMEEFPRQCIFIGTTNNDNYLKDPTGARRFWPMPCSEDIRFEAVSKLRDQLLAEALGYYYLDEPVYLENPVSQAQAKELQSARTIQDEWTSVVRTVLADENWKLEAFEIADVARQMVSVGAHKLSPYDVQRISNCLKQLGYEKFRESEGARRRLWKLPPSSADQGSSKGPWTEKTTKYQRFM
jgi:predicted P-loop ATPase